MNKDRIDATIHTWCLCRLAGTPPQPAGETPGTPYLVVRIARNAGLNEWY